MKAKKINEIIFCLGLLITSILVNAQNGLENVIVEKYYVSDAADSAASIGILPVGSVTYRIYLDMLPGYKFQVAYGDENHPLLISTTTSFFNNEDRGHVTPSYSKVQAANNTVMLDSWLSVGAACEDNFGILKTEDNTVETINNLNGILKNSDISAGIPLTVRDGIIAGFPGIFGKIGIDSEISVFNATSQAGNSFMTTNGGWYCLEGAKGPDTLTNKLLIAQITTNGILHYELNVQIGTQEGDVQSYVSDNPVDPEITIPGMHGTIGTKPSIKLTSPSADTTIKPDVDLLIRAEADADMDDPSGSIVSVEFFVDNVSIGVDSSAPYSANYAGDSIVTTHQILAKVSDNKGGQVLSSAVLITVSKGDVPVITLTNPANNASFSQGDEIELTADANDLDGTIDLVEFMVDDISIGFDNSAPYTANYTTLFGTHTLTAKATDNDGNVVTSSVVTINVTITDIGLNTFSSAKLIVYPNPATDRVIIDIFSSDQSSDLSYRIISHDGKVVINKELGRISEKHSENINLSCLAKGLYTVILIRDGVVTSSQKISIQ